MFVAYSQNEGLLLGKLREGELVYKDRYPLARYLTLTNKPDLTNVRTVEFATDIIRLYSASDLVCDKTTLANLSYSYGIARFLASMPRGRYVLLTRELDSYSETDYPFYNSKESRNSLLALFTVIVTVLFVFGSI